MKAKKLIHYDLFAGIGGFSLAVDNIFKNYERKHIFCEWEDYPTAVLKKHWPGEAYYGDIADLVADTDSQRLQDTRNNAKGRPTKFNETHENKKQRLCILTGGFPCQPFSQAGRRKGTSDDRYKWPEMFAVIRNVRPDWVIAENVRGLVTWNDGMVLETVCADLENEGYEVQPIVIPACAIGAPHRRDRVWIIANNRRARLEEARAEQQTTRDRGDGEQHTPNPRQQLRSEGSGERVEADTTIGTTRPEANQREHQYTWEDDWREVAFATCDDSVDDGLPRRMGGVTISAAKHRKEQLKAYGNAIVPQVAEMILNAIKLTDES